MKNKILIIICLTLLSSCGWIHATGRTVESVGEGVGHAVEETGNAVGDAAEETEDAIN